MTNLVGPAEVDGIREAVVNNVLDMVCLVQRDAAPDALDEYERLPNWQTLHAAMPCHYWIESSLELQAKQTTNVEAVIEDARVLCPVDAGIAEDDRIASISHLGVQVTTAPLEVRGIVRRPYYLELLVREVR